MKEVLRRSKSFFLSVMVVCWFYIGENAYAEAAPDFNSTKLTGDWGGERTKLAEKGITLDIDMMQEYQGIVNGGKSEKWQYGGSLDYWLKLDFEKMGLWPGAFLDIHAESQFGKFINGDTGAIIPANSDGVFPYSEQHTTTLSQVVFTQFLSERFGLFFGKVETLGGDWNYFANSRGNDQFMNLGFVFNPVVLRAVPYSSLGGGAILLFPELSPNKEDLSMLTVSFLGPDGQPGQAPWDDFDSGTVSAAEFRLPTRFFAKPGGQLVGAAYSSRDFTALDQNPRLILGDILQGLPVTLQEHSGSSCFYYNFYQFIVSDEKDPKKGWGVFGRYGWGDEKTNPISDFYSIGLGGKGTFDGRDKDTWGAGYFYTALSDELPRFVRDRFGNSEGYEIFYNIEVKPWLHVTPDFQIIDPSNKRADVAYVAGFRVRMDF
jgi:porin